MNSILVWILIITLSTGSNWQVPLSPLLPNDDYYSAVGVYNDIIFLLGGNYNKQQSVQYDIQQNTITNTSVSFPVYGKSQYFTQINNYLYMIHETGIQFQRYNLETNILDNNWNNIVIPTDVDDSACLTGNQYYLFIVGGKKTGNAADELQIFNISGNSWLSLLPTMDINRLLFACIIHPISNKLYAIGGESGGSQTDTIEYININNMNNISNEQWRYLSNTLISPVSDITSVIYQEYIYVIGGWDDISGKRIHNTVHAINVINESVRIASYLNYSICASSSIIANNMLYVFGGWIADNVGTNQWQYYQLPTYAPTDIPTRIPTTDIPTTTVPTTDNPTTNNPTSMIPTSLPTTSLPTTSITGQPTIEPTLYPTLEPTLEPILILSTASLTIVNTETGTNVPGVDSRETDNTESLQWVYILIGVIVFCACLIVIIVFIRYWKKRKENQTNKLRIKEQFTLELNPQLKAVLNTSIHGTRHTQTASNVDKTKKPVIVEMCGNYKNHAVAGGKKMQTAGADDDDISESDDDLDQDDGPRKLKIMIPNPQLSSFDKLRSFSPVSQDKDNDDDFKKSHIVLDEGDINELDVDTAAVTNVTMGENEDDDNQDDDDNNDKDDVAIQQKDEQIQKLKQKIEQLEMQNLINAGGGTKKDLYDNVNDAASISNIASISNVMNVNDDDDDGDGMYNHIGTGADGDGDTDGGDTDDGDDHESESMYAAVNGDDDDNNTVATVGKTTTGNGDDNPVDNPDNNVALYDKYMQGTTSEESSSEGNVDTDFIKGIDVQVQINVNSNKNINSDMV